MQPGVYPGRPRDLASSFAGGCLVQQQRSFLWRSILQPLVSIIDGCAWAAARLMQLPSLLIERPVAWCAWVAVCLVSVGVSKHSILDRALVAAALTQSSAERSAQASRVSRASSSP
jgi:hypothetical protein